MYVCSKCFRISNALSRGDTQGTVFKQVSKKNDVYAVHSLIWRYSVQIKKYQPDKWTMASFSM